MKARTGFVSNSSSSSFVINRDCLSHGQVRMITGHANYAEAYGLDNSPWSIEVTDDKVEGRTTMDNFDMHFFLKEVALVDMGCVAWDGAELERDSRRRKCCEDQE